MNDMLPIDLPPKIHEQLAEIAEQNGVSETEALSGFWRFLGNFLTDVLNMKPEGANIGPKTALRALFLEFLKGNKKTPAPPFDPYPTGDAWDRAVDEWPEDLEAAPLPDWALDREHIYGGRA